MGTWLGIGVIHRVAVQLQKFLRLRFLLPVTAHGEGVLTHLDGGKQSVRLGPDSPASRKKPSPWKHVLVPEALCWAQTTFCHLQAEQCGASYSASLVLCDLV